MSKNSIRTRFAPSPTGYLHIGGLRTALFNYLLAHHHGGDFVLRIEDTDRERYLASGVEQLIQSLEWAGVSANEGPTSEGKEVGEYGPYAQSMRKEKLKNYDTYAEQLLEEGLAYRSFTSREDLQRLREEAQANKQAFIYRKSMEPEDADTDGDYTIRLDVKKFFSSAYRDNAYFFEDEDGWKVRWSEANGWSMDGWRADTIDDFIIVKADGYPTYNFANIVDDYQMEITHVLRGDEFVSSTPKHIMLYCALGLADAVPEFVHLPPINGADGKKLSKRTGDTNVLDYRDKGYLPEALISSLALLGWNDGTEQEIYTLEELIERFSLQRVQKSPAVFDIERLQWVNGTLIRQLPLDELYEKTDGYWPQAAANYSSEYRKRVLSLIHERLKFLSEIEELTGFFFTTPESNFTPSDEEKQWLVQTISELEASDFSEEDLETRLRGLAERLAAKPGKLFMLIRRTSTGSKVSPGLFETLNTLGKEEVLKRLKSYDKA